MDNPIAHTRCSVECRLLAAPVRDGLRSIQRREDKLRSGNVRKTGEQFLRRRRERNEVRLAVLGAMALEHDGVSIDLTPSQLANLFSAGAGQDQKLDRWCQRTADSAPNSAQLIVVEH